MPKPNLAADEFVAAFARHGRTLWLLAAAWVGGGEAADLVQETARIAWQRRDSCRAGSDIGAWLAQIVRHTGANWRRKRRPEATDPALLQPLAAGAPAIGAGVVDVERLPDAVARALQSLPEVARACLLLQVVGGMTFPEIATMLDLPENTAMSHARRARLALRSALGVEATAPHPVVEAP